MCGFPPTATHSDAQMASHSRVAPMMECGSVAWRSYTKQKSNGVANNLCSCGGEEVYALAT